MKKIFTFIMIVAAFAVYGQVSLDPTFGEEGIISVSGIADAYDIALDQQGNIFVVAIDSSYKAILMKFSANGLIDHAFGDNGIVRPDDATLSSPRILILSDSKILIALSISNHLMLLRYDNHGVLDETFATNGKLIIDEGLSSLQTMKLLEDDAVLITAWANDNGFVTSAMIKINSDGEIDRQFGNNGSFIISISFFYILDFIILPDNNLLCVGNCAWPYNGSDEYSFCCKIDQQGDFIHEFGEDGIVKFSLSDDPMPGTEALTHIKALNDKEILVAGYKRYLNKTVCLKMDPLYGIIESDFGDDGFLWNDFSYIDVEIQGDEKILIGEMRKSPFTIVRLLPDGSFDDTFYNQGTAEVVLPFEAYLRHFIIQDGNKLILCGLTNSEIIMARISLGEVNLIDDENNVEKIKIYPNPTNGKLEVRSDEVRAKKTEIFDILGRQVFETTEMVFNIEHLPAGIYILHIKTDKGVTNRRIVKY